MAQSIQEVKLSTSINQVTVFLQGAQVSRSGKTDISIGKTTIKIPALSPYIDGKSIQVKAFGKFTILSVNHKLNYLNSLKRDEDIQHLKTEIKSIEFDISTNSSRLEILKEKQSLMDRNKYLSSETSSASLSQLKQAMDFFDRELTKIKKEELQKKITIKELNEKKSKLEQQISDVYSQEELPSSEIEIRVDAPTSTKCEFIISYLVSNTGWYPKYDLRVNNINQPLKLEYKADVYQNTGVDWHNVQLQFSNGNPNQSGVAPKLQTWYLNYARNTVYNRFISGVVSNSVRKVSGRIYDSAREPLPGANIRIEGSTIGTISDFDGNYSLTLPNGAENLVISFVGFVQKSMPITSSIINVQLQEDSQQLSEVVATGFSKKLSGSVSGVSIRGKKSYSNEADPITTTTVENQSTFEFSVETPYSIKSNGEKLSVDLNSYNIETIYEYYAVPKLDKDAFLIAKIVNWDQYNLLEGETNLYFEEAYVGRSILDAGTLTDTLSISLGRDKNIVIGRTKIEEFSKRRTIGGNKIENRGFKIIARNKKSQPVNLTLVDQLPKAAISDIIVNAVELSEGKMNEKTKEVTWKLELPAQQQTELTIAYEVKYPKKEKVNLE